MRHGLREAIAWAMLDAAGLMGDALSEAALRLLFAGGMVTGSGGDAIKLSEYRELVGIVPSLGLLGGCAQNHVVPGAVHCDEAVLICEETLPTIERLAPSRVERRTNVEHRDAREDDRGPYADAVNRNIRQSTPWRAISG